ncbi:MAG: hypothetical protein A4E66_02152 [Syntrophus sp. PtaB.Bin001]|nr:MAG: hypothetical protein A4E66_02152 [Syntrophus sp. PtaB.Bin001]
MIQYLQLSLFDVMPDAEVNSLIEQIPCRVAKSRIRSSKPKLPYFHWRITNIYDYADYPIDCLKGPHEKTGFALRLYPKGWGVYTGAIQHVSKRNVFAMLDWLHEQQAKPRKDLFNPKEVLYDQNRSHNAGL